jgi:redox-sensitive bicupin YhaK (pirin superfamily)
MGNHGVVEPGGVQFMSAGSGVEHSEFNDDPVAPLHFVQMWVLPGARGTAPSYGQRQFTAADRHNTWLRVASGRSGVEAPIRLTQQATLSVARVENAELNYEFDPARYGFLFVASGAVEANGERLAHGDTVRMYDVRRLTVSGDGELVLWDLPEVSA